MLNCLFKHISHAPVNRIFSRTFRSSTPTMAFATLSSSRMTPPMALSLPLPFTSPTFTCRPSFTLRRNSTTTTTINPLTPIATTHICQSYASPEVYDIAFSFRDFEAEVAFLLAAHQKHSKGALSSFLEIGCGPGRHSILLAKSTGATCIGVDAVPEMLSFAAQQAKRAGVAAGKTHFIQGDMTSADGFMGKFSENAAVGIEKVDVAAILLGTLSHCLDNTAALQCFKNTAEVVRPGGLLILELAHPGELFAGSFLDPLDFVDCWEVDEHGNAEFAEKRHSTLDEMTSDSDNEEGEEERSGKTVLGDSADEVKEKSSNSSKLEEDDDGDEDVSSLGEGVRRVLVEYGREGDDFDPATQILKRTVGLSLFDVSAELVSSDVSVVPQRQFSLQEIDLLARATGWVIVAVHGDLDEVVPLESDDAYRMVVVLRRN